MLVQNICWIYLTIDEPICFNFFAAPAIFTELDAQFTIQVSIELMAMGPSLLNNERSPWSLSKAKVLWNH